MDKSLEKAVENLSGEFQRRGVWALDQRSLVLPVGVVGNGEPHREVFFVQLQGDDQESVWAVQGYGGFCEPCDTELSATGDAQEDLQMICDLAAKQLIDNRSNHAASQQQWRGDHWDVPLR